MVPRERERERESSKCLYLLLTCCARHNRPLGTSQTDIIWIDGSSNSRPPRKHPVRDFNASNYRPRANETIPFNLGSFGCNVAPPACQCRQEDDGSLGRIDEQRDQTVRSIPSRPYHPTPQLFGREFKDGR
jgi:hypothetical protein